MAKPSLSLGLQLALVLTTISIACAAENVWQIRESLHSEGKYMLTRTVDMNTKRITFKVEVATMGYVGFGLSPTGSMDGADIVIGGVHNNGTAYFEDRHGKGTSTPQIDSHADWFLIGNVTQNATHTTMEFHRNFDTCDDNDVAITDDTLSIIWSFGASNNLVHHGENRGSKRVNLLDPKMPQDDVSKLDKWTIMVNDTMPSMKTAYWCSIHRAPVFPEVHHMIGFDAILPSEQALKHTHHFLFQKCVAPAGMDPEELFGQYVGQPARDCSTSKQNPYREHCAQATFVWAVGGQRTMLPENVGLPISENPGKEFYMMEVHYDNPSEISGMNFSTGLEIYYVKPEPKAVEAGVFVVGHNVWFAHVIPPNAVNFKTIGHCPSECTQRFLPPEGIKIFNVMLHSHLSGRQLKLRHFRNGVELPWPAVDFNYDFNYQQNRPLREELVLLPGDHLTYECITDTTWKNGTVTIGDLGTEDEMCETFFIYYPRMRMDMCESTYDALESLKYFGIKNFTADENNSNGLIVTDPPEWAGMKYFDVINLKVNWTQDYKDKYQHKIITEDHDFYCTSFTDTDLNEHGKTNYPKFPKAYERENVCHKSDAHQILGIRMWSLVPLFAIMFCLI